MSTSLLTAIDRNWRVAMRAFGLAPQVQIRDDDQVFWYVTGMADPAFNSIMYAQLAPDQIEDVVQELRGLRETYAVPMNWLVGADSRPPDLGRYLVAAGLRHLVDLPLMSADLAALRDEQARPAELTIQRVESDSLWAEWIAAEQQGFEVEASLRTGHGGAAGGHGLRAGAAARALSRAAGRPARGHRLAAAGRGHRRDLRCLHRAQRPQSRRRRGHDAARPAGGARSGLPARLAAALGDGAIGFYERLGFRAVGACGIFG